MQFKYLFGSNIQLLPASMSDENNVHMNNTYIQKASFTAIIFIWFAIHPGSYRSCFVLFYFLPWINSITAI